MGTKLPSRAICKGAVLGALLGMLAILAYAFTRRSIREPEEIRRELNQRCLAALPQVTFKRRCGAVDRTVSIRNKKTSGAFQESVRMDEILKYMIAKPTPLHFEDGVLRREDGEPFFDHN